MGIVFNLDPHDKPGSHWVSMYVDLNNGGIYYFDSYGYKPLKEILFNLNKKLYWLLPVTSNSKNIITN